MSSRDLRSVHGFVNVFGLPSIIFLPFPPNRTPGTEYPLERGDIERRQAFPKSAKPRPERGIPVHIIIIMMPQGVGRKLGEVHHFIWLIF